MGLNELSSLKSEVSMQKPLSDLELAQFVPYEEFIRTEMWGYNFSYYIFKEEEVAEGRTFYLLTIRRHSQEVCWKPTETGGNTMNKPVVNWLEQIVELNQEFRQALVAYGLGNDINALKGLKFDLWRSDNDSLREKHPGVVIKQASFVRVVKNSNGSGEPVTKITIRLTVDDIILDQKRISCVDIEGPIYGQTDNATAYPSDAYGLGTGIPSLVCMQDPSVQLKN